MNPAKSFEFSQACPLQPFRKGIKGSPLFFTPTLQIGKIKPWRCNPLRYILFLSMFSDVNINILPEFILKNLFIFKTWDAGYIGSVWLLKWHKVTRWNSDLPPLSNSALPPPQAAPPRFSTQTLWRHKRRDTHVAFSLSVHITVCISVTVFQWVQSPAVQEEKAMRDVRAFHVPPPPPFPPFHSTLITVWKRHLDKEQMAVFFSETLPALLWEAAAISTLPERFWGVWGVGVAGFEGMTESLLPIIHRTLCGHLVLCIKKPWISQNPLFHFPRLFKH